MHSEVKGIWFDSARGWLERHHGREMFDRIDARVAAPYRGILRDALTSDWYPEEALAELDADALVAEVGKIRGKKAPLSVADHGRLREEHAKSVVPLQAMARHALALEQRVSDLVNGAYGLTPDEVRLLWDTAPPRMPIGRPSAI